MQRSAGIVVPGHRVASGLAGNERYPGGTIALQKPFFAAAGFDIGGYYNGTLNVRTERRFRLVRPEFTAEAVRWCADPAETFSFVRCWLEGSSGKRVPGLVYYPHPETKPCHFQPNNVVEVLLERFEPGFEYGTPVQLEVAAGQAEFE